MCVKIKLRLKIRADHFSKIGKRIKIREEKLSDFTLYSTPCLKQHIFWVVSIVRTSRKLAMQWIVEPLSVIEKASLIRHLQQISANMNFSKLLSTQFLTVTTNEEVILKPTISNKELYNKIAVR